MVSLLNAGVFFPMLRRRGKFRERIQVAAHLLFVGIKASLPYLSVVAALFGAPMVIILILQIIGCAAQ